MNFTGALLPNPPPPGALPLQPAGGLPSPRPPVPPLSAIPGYATAHRSVRHIKDNTCEWYAIAIAGCGIEFGPDYTVPSFELKHTFIGDFQI